MMRLWLIERGGDGYDQYFGFVVRAESEVGARRIAAARHADEGAAVWMDAKRSTCAELTAEGEAGVILADFSAG